METKFPSNLNTLGGNMAVLQLEDGRTYTDIRAIASQLAVLNIEIDSLPPNKNPAFQELLVQDILNVTQKQQILAAFNSEFEQFKRVSGYRWCDLKVLHPGSQQIYALMTQSHRTHTHTDAEVLHILAGECVFGFVYSNGSQVQLMLQAEEYIKVPANTEHWFYLTPSLYLKALQYYTSAQGWVPQYTNRQLKIKN
ncbi:acireductone dioxygenase [Microcoleus vaginatus]|uniref:acireductone dioxygenase n=1 Tax=Microcoleus vaginatus TaxID=119532 RepID=UPI001F5FF911|nr:acireductone dioxygenase [Microcoleus vaginatus HSN003]